MLTPLALFLGLLAATAFIAHWSDNLGKKLGKKRVSVFGLRPRTSATILTVVSSWGIMIFTLVALLLAVEPLKTALFSYDAARASFAQEQADFDLERTRFAGERARFQGDRARFVADLGSAQSKTKSVEANYKSVSANYKSVSANLSQANKAKQKVEQGARVAQKIQQAAQRGEQSAKLAERNAKNGESVALGAANAARQQEQQARLAFTTANARLAQTQAQLGRAQNQFQAASANLNQKQGQVSKVQNQLAVSQKQLASSKKQLASSFKQLVASYKQVASSYKDIAQAKAQVAQAKTQLADLKQTAITIQKALTISEREAAKSDNLLNFLAYRDIRVAVDQTLAERRLDINLPLDQIQQQLRDLVLDAQRATLQLAPQAQVSARAIGTIQKNGKPVSISLTENQVIERYAQLLSLGNQPVSARLVSTVNYPSDAREIAARFTFVQMRPIYSQNDSLTQAQIDGSQGDAPVFGALTRLVDEARQSAVKQGANPPLSPDAPNFFASDTNQRLFDALREVRQTGRTVAVSVVAARNLNAAEPLQIRFQIGDSSAT